MRNPMMRAANGAASTMASVANATLRGPLECGVQTAYAVIDEYMRRGYEAARGQERQTGETYMNNEKPNYGSSYSSPFNPFSQAAPMMEQWMRFWMDAWSALIPGARMGPFGYGYGAPQPGCPPAGFATGAPAPPVSVWVSSARPVEVTVNLKPGTFPTDLTADSFVPALNKSVTLQRKDGRLHVSVQVSADQAAGRYTGVIRCADGSIAGDLTVVIADAAKYPV